MLFLSLFLNLSLDISLKKKNNLKLRVESLLLLDLRLYSLCKMKSFGKVADF